jgi:putative cell wall-binding protein
MIATMTPRARRRLFGLVGLGLLALPLAPAPAAAAPEAATPGGFDGNPATTERVNEGHPTFAAVDISKIRYPDGGAGHVVLARDDSFADSVAGSGLTGDGPLLFTSTKRLSAPTAAEIDRVLDSGDTVYLLGGTAAIADGVADTLRKSGYVVKRLAGKSRIGTAIKVADEVRRLHPGDDVLLARSTDWADSVSGGGVAAARNTPVLVTPTETLHPAVAAWLANDAPATTTLLGGTAALSKAVEDAVPHPRRVSGTDRTATAAAVATKLWDASPRYVVTNGLADNGWSFGFAAAGLAADAGAPILLVTDEVTDPTTDLVRTCGAPAVDVEVVGDGSVVPAALREQLDAADGYACGPGGALVYPTDLSTFPACADLLASFKQSALERVGPYGLGGFGSYGGDPRVLEATPAAPGADTGGDQSSSTTNVQEEGVDEPDIVKTTATHAYVIAQGELQIVRLNGGAPSIESRLALPANGGHELLLSGNRLLVVTRTFAFGIAEDQPASTTLLARGEAKSTLTYVDVTDPAHPRVDSTLVVDGDYRSARMIGSVARLVIQSDPDALELTFPADATPEAEQAAAEHNREVIEATTLDDWLPSYAVDGGADAALLGCDDVRRPPLFSGLGTLSVLTIDLAGTIQPTSSAAVVASGENVYASASRLFVTTGRWDWSPEALGTTVTTEVHGFDISTAAATSYIGSGSVPGYVINQYALSELAGNLRIATTLEPPWSDDGTQVGSTESAIHVLAERNGSYDEIGSVGGLGLGERIYAVRYFGDMAAVVTFRQVDPLYLVDLSDPTAPRVTGQLKIPGFSAYLHRVSDGRLLGVGSEANDEGMITGSQVSLFDISDVTAPALVDKVTFPDGYTQVQYDPHAFLYWPATGLSVIPMDVFTREGSGFQGAVGVTVASSGLTEAGRASHTDDADPNSFPQITRAFVAAGVLYTVSDSGVEADDLGTLAEVAFLRF